MEERRLEKKRIGESIMKRLVEQRGKLYISHAKVNGEVSLDVVDHNGLPAFNLITPEGYTIISNPNTLWNKDKYYNLKILIAHKIAKHYGFLKGHNHNQFTFRVEKYSHIWTYKNYKLFLEGKPAPRKGCGPGRRKKTPDDTGKDGGKKDNV